MNYWLLKTEPETFSFEELLKEKRTPWNGVRNFQARNFLKSAQLGDLALIYHSGKQKAVVGVAKVVRSSYPESDPNKAGDWVQIDIEAKLRLERPVTLGELKSIPQLKELLLFRQSRLSVMPVSKGAFDIILRLGNSK
jgi:predicted RNA-binding protein with PUA-like domain